MVPGPAHAHGRRTPCRAYMEAYEAAFTQADLDFIYRWAVATRLGRERLPLSGRRAGKCAWHAPTEHWQFHQNVVRQLQRRKLKEECTKLWESCTLDEQAELMALVASPAADKPSARRSNAPLSCPAWKTISNFLPLAAGLCTPQDVTQPAAPTPCGSMWKRRRHRQRQGRREPDQPRIPANAACSFRTSTKCGSLPARNLGVGRKYFDEVEDARI